MFTVTKVHDSLLVRVAQAPRITLSMKYIINIAAHFQPRNADIATPQPHLGIVTFAAHQPLRPLLDLALISRARAFPSTAESET